MWQLDNRTPFAAERGWVRDRSGSEIWIVAVKCTFDIKPDGATVVSGQQPPVTIAPELTNPKTPAQSSLRSESDLVRTRLTTDIVVHGHAYAPNDLPVTSCDVGFRVGELTKRLRVTGDRYWIDGSPSAPTPFTRMPLLYERAYGGYDPASLETDAPQWEQRNPAGTGYARSAASANRRKLPNIEYREHLISSPRQHPPPAGFGPIPPHWPPRSAYAGTYDDTWQADRSPLLPLDFDDRHYQCVPPDQQTQRFLTGGEKVALLNLSPVPLLQFALPRIFLGFETLFTTGERQLHEPPKLHTVILEPDFPRVSLLWHTALPCHPKVLKLKETRIYLKRAGGGVKVPDEQSA
ncbi:MAG: DUF2169 family type VI secretion system accessory protein [Acetobacteraceae bacterium]